MPLRLTLTPVSLREGELGITVYANEDGFNEGGTEPLNCLRASPHLVVSFEEGVIHG